MGEHAEFSSGGGQVAGYLAKPDHGSAGPGLIVLGPRLATDPHTTGVCDRLAAEGFTALAPALVTNEGQGELDRALGVNFPVTVDQLRGAIAFLEDHPDVHGQGVGVVGFGGGSLLALAVAAEVPADVKAVAVFDGPILEEDAADRWARVEAPVECHLGAAGSDHVLGRVEALLEAAKELKLSVDAFTYGSAAPGFFDETSSAHDADAAHDAWIRTLSFLRAHLG